MSTRSIRWQSDRAEQPDPHAELRTAELAGRQLERAELYVVAAIELELANPEVRLALERLRGAILKTGELLRRPHRIR